MTNQNMQPQAPTPQQPIQPQQPGYTPIAQPQTIEKHMSALGITGFVLAILALVLSWIPIVNNMAFVFAIAGLVFALFALHATGKKGKRKGRALVVAALVISLMSGGVVLYTQSVYGKAADQVSKSLDDASKQLKHDSENYEKGIVNEGAKELKMQVTISNGDSEVIYGMDGGSSNETITGSWEKTITGDDAQKAWTVSAYPSFNLDGDTPDDTQVTCTITVDGKQVSHKEATGDSANVHCSVYDKDN